MRRLIYQSSEKAGKPKFPRHPVPASAGPIHLMEMVGKAAQALIAIIAVATAAALLLGYVLISRYLAAFGQPGLTSSNDSGSMLVGAAAVFLVVALILAGAAGTPLFVRFLSDRWTPEEPRSLRAALRRYGLLHAPVLIALYVCSIHLWMGLAAAAACLILCVFYLGRGSRERLITSAGTLLLANLGWVIWAAILGKGLGSIYDSYLQPLIWLEGSARLVLPLGLLVFVHGCLSLLPLRGAACLVVLLASGLLMERGDRAVTALALRWLNLGGGTPMTYVRRSEGGAPAFTSPACLIVSAGEQRVVWLPPDGAGAQVTKTTSSGGYTTKKVPCDLSVFIERTRSGGSDADHGMAADELVRVLKPEDFGGLP